MDTSNVSPNGHTPTNYRKTALSRGASTKFQRSRSSISANRDIASLQTRSQSFKENKSRQTSSNPDKAVGRTQTAVGLDKNEDLFYPNSTVLKFSPASQSRYSTSFWLGCEYKYLPVSDKFMIKFHQAGALPREHKDNNKVFIKVILGDSKTKTTTKVNFGKVGDLKKDSTEIYLSGFSCADRIKTDLNLKLYIEEGIFSTAKLLEEWSIQIDKSKLLDWQSKWMHILK